MGELRRFTCTRNGANKFWEISEPSQIFKDMWSVDVRFGRIGTTGQPHRKVFSSKFAARNHYIKKISEKLSKGYNEAGQATVSKNVVTYHSDYIPVKPKPCTHDDLSRKGQTWSCKNCGQKVEFEKSLRTDSGRSAVVATEITVRRYFDLGSR